MTGEEGKHLLVVGPAMVQADGVAIIQGMKDHQEQSPQPLDEGERPVDAILVVAPDPDIGAVRPAPSGGARLLRGAGGISVVPQQHANHDGCAASSSSTRSSPSTRTLSR